MTGRLAIYFSDTDPLSQLHIGVDEDLQSKIRLLCHKFREIFSNELPDSPALIPPFDIVVDDTKWKVSKNRTACSLYSTVDPDQGQKNQKLDKIFKGQIFYKWTAPSN